MVDKKKDLINQIKREFSQLSKGQKLIAEYIISNYDKAAFMTASKIGQTVGVSESTVVRFANTLGFEGYPQLQRALQEIIKTKLTTVQRVEMGTQYTNEGDIIRKVLRSDMDNINYTLENIDYDVFQKVINEIFLADKIYIVGLRSSTALAEYFGFYLNMILDNVRIVGYGVSDIFEQTLRVTENDLVIGISFPRYSNRTIEALRYIKEQNVKIIGITDTVQSPLNEICNYTLTAKSNMASFVDSLVAPLSLINAIIVAVGMREKDEITEYFNKLENIWERYNIYNNKRGE
ncbi:MurR/RpiR family transcriptional regulator [Isachenkonia alkalipeptolytica]|uniref:MurR/RpiR family transcriptional regulator n=1 Tax=Isachenkonia alkalipeptolytica TaxID=2565777 RepID=A0AA43XLY6_9CLOT|nr:MurR/RpiR family transcriptional regulator [Isachenkonia alkalipeptolytica]NBG88759.1 MurR/RpiR family transcriptional regulator [Isachenkonia alkalipeptolytica]